MALVDQLLPQFDHEMSATRTTLQRVPAERFTWHPDPKMMTLGALTNHLMNVPLWVGPILTASHWDLSSAAIGDREAAESTADLVALFNDNVREARAHLSAVTDEQLQESLAVTRGEETLLTLSRLDAIRNIVLNHQTRHREQLTTYLSLLESARALRERNFAEFPESAAALAAAGQIA